MFDVEITGKSDLVVINPPTPRGTSHCRLVGPRQHRPGADDVGRADDLGGCRDDSDHRPRPTTTSTTG